MTGKLIAAILILGNYPKEDLLIGSGFGHVLQFQSHLWADCL